MADANEDGRVETVMPDLTGVTLADLAEIDGTVLGNSVEDYLQRLRETGAPLCSFNARI